MTERQVIWQNGGMRALRCSTIATCAAALAITAFANPETVSSGKEMKQVAPAPPPECNWTGFYIGINIGGQWGHSEDKDHDYNVGPPPFQDFDKPWGYDESGVVAAGQVGYNFQWNWLVLGVEAEGGYMDLNGRGHEPGSHGDDTVGKSDSDFFTTIRGRLGIALGHWLFYGTGGGIGVNYETEIIDDCDVFPCGAGLLRADKQEFDWGWTAGGGIEYMLRCHWTIRAEYLRYELDEQDFSGTEFVRGIAFGEHEFRANTEGNIFRAALNYKF